MNIDDRIGLVDDSVRSEPQKRYIRTDHIRAPPLFAKPFLFCAMLAQY